MSGSTTLGFWEDIRPKLILLSLLTIILLAFVAVAGEQSSAFVSSEAKFTDASASGLAIVPASCPSSPHYAGECDAPPGSPPGGGGGGGGGGSGGGSGGGACAPCNADNQCASGNCNHGDGICEPVASCGGSGSGGGGGGDVCPNIGGTQSSVPSGYTIVNGQCIQQCTPAFSCVGNSLYYTNSSCQNLFQQVCSYQCSTSGCVTPPPPEFEAFNATYKGNPFSATGHLQAIPVLVQQGETVQIYWQVENISSCTVTGSNGDLWSDTFSGTTGKTSGSITAQTLYTLSCQALPGATPPSLSESRTINIVPIFEEQ